MQQCIEAVDYCHRHNVAHRDLKLDNTLLDGSSPPFIKICDFGFAKLMGTDNLVTKIGTPVYMAPALIKKGQQGYSGRASGAHALHLLLSQLVYRVLLLPSQLVYRVLLLLSQLVYSVLLLLGHSAVVCCLSCCRSETVLVVHRT